MKNLSVLLCLLLFPIFVEAQSTIDTLRLRTIFMEPNLAGTRPSFSFFSSDDRTVFFEWNDSSYSNKSLYQVNINGRHLQKSPEKVIKDGVLSPNERYIAFIKEGDLWISDNRGNDRHCLLASPVKEMYPVWSPDSRQIAFTRGGNIWVANIQSHEIKQITNKRPSVPGYYTIGWVDSDKKLVVEQENNSGMKEYYFPEYLHKFVEPGGTKRGIPISDLSVMNTKSGKTQLLLKGKMYFRNIDISPDSRYLAVDIFDAPMKHRKIVVYDFKQDTSYTVFRDSTKGWFTWEKTEMDFAPSKDVIMFTSERTGWNHIYTVNPNGSDMKQWTSGNYEIEWVQWLNDDQFVYASTQVSPGERHIYTLSLKNPVPRDMTPATAYREDFHLSHNHRFVVYRKSYWNKPDELYVLNVRRPGKEIRLTHSVPKRFKEIDWQIPQYVHFTGRDGHTQIYMTILKPRHFEQGEKYPVVIFVHGAGSLQDVFKGWSTTYHHEHMFNQFLADHGYIVINVDYRQSLGYGRKFREDVEGWLGHYETQDLIDALHNLDKRGYADLSRVGIYGGSYGGFLSLYAISTHPEYFRAAAALRAVTNWRNYYYTNPWYTYPRLGTPEKNPENYERSSPLTYADSLKRPVLILHGLRDNNVGYQDAAEFIHQLIKSGNHNFQFMMYPAERHAFKKDYDWLDEYTRIYRFLNKELKNKMVETTK